MVEFKKISLDFMIEYIENNAPQDKAWFKSVAFDENGRYQHLRTVRAFCKKYMPEIIPEAKPKKAPISNKIKDW